MKNTIGADSFAAYLVKTYLATKGYKIGTVPEASGLAAASNIVLTYLDGMICTIICIIDRETNPDDYFALSLEAINELGEQCLKYTGKVSRRQLPVDIRVFEIGSAPFTRHDLDRLKAMKQFGFANVKISSWALTPSTASVWTNFPLGGPLVGRFGLKKLMQMPRKSDAEIKAAGIVVLRPAVFPILSCILLAAMVGVFALEQVFTARPSVNFLTPDVRTLVALGGLSRIFVFNFGEWYRIFSAVLLHGGLFHLVMNGIALFLAGAILEGLVGRAWFTLLFVAGAMAGSGMSLALNPPNIVSVGASGAIMCLLAAAFVCSFRMPMGVNRTQNQMSLMGVLVPSLIPLAYSVTGQHVDFGAHLGGALMGVLAGIGLLAIWPQTLPTPRFARAAAVLSVAALCVFAYSGVRVADRYPVYTAHVAVPAMHPAKSSPSSNKGENR